MPNAPPRPYLIHAERDFLVLDKPAGVAVHGGPGIGSDTIVAWLIRKYPEVKHVGDPSIRSGQAIERPGIVHRLDKDTSGVLLVARNQPAFEALKQLFKERKVEKTYLALVVGVPKKKSGVIDAPIGRSPRRPTKRAVGAAIRQPRQAVTRYRVLERFPANKNDRRYMLSRGGHALLEVKPHTGRMHQIRVHLAALGNPIAGDRVYGGAQAALPGLQRQFLHAWRLGFSYPEGRRWQFESALPKALDRVLKQLRRLQRRKNHAT